MTDRCLAIRADAGAGAGAGHVMRSLALADAWRRGGGAVEWFSSGMPPMLVDLIAARGITQHRLASASDWDFVCTWSRLHSGCWVAVDGYGFAAGPARLQGAGARVLVIDDTGGWPRYDCDVLLNQNPGADAIPYRTTAVTRLCGPSYALIRDEFRAVDPPARTFARRAERILVSFGGHDTHGQTARVVRMLMASDPALVIDAVSGVVAQEDDRSAGSSVTYHNTTNLASLMCDADAAIVAAGSICWELCYLGLPALGLIVADNQRAVAEGLDRAGVIRNLGWFDTIEDDALSEAMTRFLDDPVQAEMSRRGRALVDGDGAQRAIEAMLAVEQSRARGGAMA